MNCTYFAQRFVSIPFKFIFFGILSFLNETLPTAQSLVILFMWSIIYFKLPYLHLVSERSIKSFCSYFSFLVIIWLFVSFFIKFYVSDYDWFLAYNRHALKIFRSFIIFFIRFLIRSTRFAFLLWVLFLLNKFFHFLSSLILTFYFFWLFRNEK